MKFMNEYDLHFAAARFTRASKPNRLGATHVIAELAEWANEVSDGFAYWAKPCNAAQGLIALVESTTNQANDEQERVDATDEELAKALRPVKAFLTRQGVSAERREVILRGGQPVSA
jgi:predicted Ser/Thr protein kinase